MLTSMGKSVVEMKGIGPIPSMEVGSWEFERVFSSRVVNEVKIRKVKIQYMDNTFKEYPNVKLIL
jgi:ribosome-associated toxin RatA of RatAB toxin-antitoxin module